MVPCHFGRVCANFSEKNTTFFLKDEVILLYADEEGSKCLPKSVSTYQITRHQTQKAVVLTWNTDKHFQT